MQKEVTRARFFEKLNAETKDVIYSAHGSFPYVRIYKYRADGREFGRATPATPDGTFYKYFLTID